MFSRSSMKNPAYRRYTRRMLPLSLLYVGAIMLASWLVADRSTINAVSVGLALLPGLAILGWIWAMARLLIELDDEFLRLLEVRKVLVATGVTLAACSVWGLLEIYTNVPRLPVFLVFPLWAMGLFVGMLVNRVTLGSAGACP